MFEHFDTELYRKSGWELLSFIPIYYDFDWQAKFHHDKAEFPYCKCLANRVKNECPIGKKPAIILTIREDVDIGAFETEIYYAVVVKIDEYLNPNYDHSANYFADESQIPLTRSTLFKNVMKTPELVDQIIKNGLTIEMIGKWAIVADERMQQLKQLVESNNNTLKNKNHKALIFANLDDIAGTLNKLIEMGNIKPLLDKLMKLDANSLEKINSITGIASLKRVLKLWDSEKQNDKEEFWQSVFTSAPWVISQVFSYPVILIADKPYVGGKAVNNVGGTIADFLYRNQFTNNVVLVEIKTPMTKLLSSKYRGNVYPISTDLSGAINQTLNFKEHIQKDYYALYRESKQKFEVINPQCLLIVGSLENEKLDEAQMLSFEMLRHDLKSLEIITFDELFAKIRILLDLLEKNEDR